MQFIGWVQYNHESQPPDYIHRNRYYKLNKSNNEYIIQHENGNEVWDLDTLKKIFKPANGYNSWDEIIENEHIEVTKKKENKTQVTKNQSIVSTNINNDKELKEDDKKGE